MSFRYSSCLVVLASLAGVASCSKSDGAGAVSMQEQALRAWAEQDRTDRQRRETLSQKQLETAKLELQNEEMRNEIVRLRGGAVDPSVLQLNLQRISSLQQSLLLDQSRRAMCESLLKTELAVYQRNRRDPKQQPQNISELRRKNCGGP